ncbi:MAG TPA: hypothetical protein DIW23_06115, partial [Anaerolineae bacterium]|nr:hypothetical protein [Anaerolineae bacterium]
MHIDKCLLANPHLVKTAPGFLISPEKVILYLGKTHLGIEYIGPERVDKNPDELKISIQVIDLYDSEDSFLEKIIGFIYDDGASNIGTMPIPTFSEGLILPTNRGADKLEELKWHINAQDGMTIFNPTHPIVSKNEFTRIINGLFFDANEKGLLTRHIKWIDFIPVINSDIEDKKEMLKVDLSVYNKNLAEQNGKYHYPLPDQYDY